jgi:TnpA family transposase
MLYDTPPRFAVPPLCELRPVPLEGGTVVKPDWHPEELERHFTLSTNERTLLGNKTGATRLGFAVLLKTFQLEGRFPDCASDLPPCVVAHLGAQCGVSPRQLETLNWKGRSNRRHRTEVRAYLGNTAFAHINESAFLAWLEAHVTDFDAKGDALRYSALHHLRSERVESPAPERLERLLRRAVRQRETRFIAETAAQLEPETRTALDALIATDGTTDEDDLQPALFAARSELATLKDAAGAVKVATVLEELGKLRTLRALGLPDDLFANVPSKMVTQYRRRAANEAPRELRRHDPDVRWTLLASLCHQRTLEITDSLVELLIHIAQHIGTHAENRVQKEFLRAFRRVAGKNKLLYKLAKAARAKPQGRVEDVIYGAVPAAVLEDVIREAEANGSFERTVRLATRNSYGRHYRRVVPLVLEALEFKCNNDRHRPIMAALELIKKHKGRASATYPKGESVPLEGVVEDDWHDLVLDERENGRVNRIAFEICTLDTLRDRVRCKEVWVEGALRFRNPDEDLPRDFITRREEYYAELEQPSDAGAFVTTLKTLMTTALERLNQTLPQNDGVKILVSKKGKGRFSISPLEVQEEPTNITALTAALVRRWPMTNLLDILKETEWRTDLTEALRGSGSREVLARDTLQRRLLLCLHGLGTNAGLKRMCSGGNPDGYDELKYVKDRYLHKDGLRAAIARVCNAIFAVRDPLIWGEATTAVASDSKQFGAWDQNLMTEHHRRYGGRGVMVYWHVEKRSACIHSQLKAPSSSEVAFMIEGVLRHETTMEVDKTYVDSHGQSEVGFAFCYLLGFSLLPRLKNLRKQRLYRVEKADFERYANLQSVMGRSIDWVCIEQQYDEMVKFATALRLGTADAETILRRFTRANVQHPTYKALGELGKAVKTAFLCDYLRLESLRREIHEGLNVIESWNAANDFILYGKGGEFATNRLEDAEVSMLCLHLLQVSLVFVNTLMVQRVLCEPEWRDRLTDTDRRALTPLKWGHVNPYGTFALDMTSRLRLEV